MSDFNFVGQAYEAASPTQDNQRLINWYPEVDPTKNEGNSQAGLPAARGIIALYPTPGLTKVAQLISGEVRAFRVIPGGSILLVICANKLYSVTTSYVATVVGTLITTSGFANISDNGTSAYITDGNTRYSYNWTTGVFATVTDGGFTGGIGCDIIDGFIFYARQNSTQWGCTSAGVVTSPALSVGSKIGSPDNIVSVIADKRQALIIGERTSERWTDAGTFPFPFTIIPGTSIQHGCQAARSIARLGEGVAFLAIDDRGQATVVTWGASFSQPIRISTFAIENAIQQYPVTSDAVAYTYTQSGHEFYVLTFPTADVTWVYDLATQMWHQRSYRNPSTGLYHRHRGNCAIPFNDEIIVGDFENGKLYKFDQSNYTDDGDPIACLRRAPHLTNELKRVFYHDLQIQFQPGVGLQTGQGSDPEFILRWSNDGGMTWGNDHLLKIGKAGKYKNRAIKRRLGWGRDRVFEIVITDPVYRVVVSANLNASGAAN